MSTAAAASSAFDPALWVELPRGLGAVARDGLAPCRCCGAMFFDVVEVARPGPSGGREALISVECPRCPLLSRKRADRRTTIGRLDLARGELVDMDREWDQSGERGTA